MLAQQPVRGGLHVQQVFGRRIDAAEHAQHKLHEYRLPDQPFSQIERQRLDVADVVALEFEARAVTVAELVKNLFDVGKGIAENDFARRVEQLAAPSRAASRRSVSSSGTGRSSSSPC